MNQIEHPQILALTFGNNQISQNCRASVRCKYVERMTNEKGREKSSLKEGIIHIPSDTCTTVNFLNSPLMLRWLQRQVQPLLPGNFLNEYMLFT